MAKRSTQSAVKISAVVTAANDQYPKGKIIKFPAKKKSFTEKDRDISEGGEDRSTDTLSLYFRESRAAKYERVSHGEFNEMAKRLDAYKEEALGYARELIYAQNYGEHVLQYAAFVARFGEPEGVYGPTRWLRSLIKSRELSAVFSLFNMQEAMLVFDRMCNANLALATSVAKKSKAHWFGLVPLEDLIQMANMGLMEAVARYDHKKGNRFSTYAVWWIRHVVEREVDDTGRSIRVPVHVMGDLRKFSRLIQHHGLDLEGNRTGAIRELAALTAIEEDKVKRTLEFGEVRKLSSLDAVFKTGENLMGVIADETENRPDQQAERSEDLRAIIALAKSWMEDRYPVGWKVLCLRFGLDGNEEHTLQEIAEIHHPNQEKALSRERIRQIETKALKILRCHMGRRGFGR